jgi:hypothetical protein
MGGGIGWDVRGRKTHPRRICSSGKM